MAILVLHFKRSEGFNLLIAELSYITVGIIVVPH